jgi:two-component system, cell cycle sensor histidine kinase and response regulator CckA
MSTDHQRDRELLFKVFETSPTAIVVLNRDGRIYLANAQAEKTLRLTHQDITVRNYDDPAWTATDFAGNLIPPDQLPFAQVKKTLLPAMNYRHAISSTEHARIFLNINAAPLFDERGEFDGMVASIEDISEKIASDAVFAESEAMLKSVFRAAPVGIGVVKNRTLTWTNYKLQQMVGYSEEQLHGKSSQILYPTQEDYDYVGREKYSQIALFGTGSVETRWLRSDGRIIDVLLSSTPIDLNDLERGVTFSALDITERKQMEERLRHSEKMEAVGQLAGGIAHDFNNQLAGIMGYADLIQDEAGENSVLLGYANGIITAARRSADLTSQLLAFARKGKYLSVSVDVHQIINEVVALLKHSIDKNIVIKQILCANPSTTNGDQSQLQNSILNLALNARDAMPDGGVLTIKTDVVELGAASVKDLLFDIEPGAYLQIDVKDTGCGIEPSHLGRIFEPFFTTKGEGKGTGLGLAAVYGAIKNHSGGIAIKSAVGKGTVFSLFLPSCCNEAENRSATLAGGDASVLAGKHILVVDDEEHIRQIAADMIASMGCRATTCGNGQEALEIYRRIGREIDVVALDLVMPEMDGKMAFHELRRLNPQIKILLISGYSIAGEAEYLLGEGARDFIQKPFLKAELLAKLSSILAR